MPIAIKSLTPDYPSAILNSFPERNLAEGMMKTGMDENMAFQQLRERVREAKVLSPAVESLLERARFTGRLSVVIQNGKILKSGYEEGYFTRRQDERSVN